MLLAEQQPVASPPSWLCRLWSTITQEFVEVCDHILPFFDHLGPVFAFARVEFAAKASSLRDTAEQHAHLHELVAADRAANRATVRQVDDTYMPATVVVFSATCAAPRAHQLTITLPASSLPFIAVAGQVKNSPTRNLHRLAAAIHFVELLFARLVDTSGQQQLSGQQQQQRCSWCGGLTSAPGDHHQQQQQSASLSSWWSGAVAALQPGAAACSCAYGNCNGNSSSSGGGGGAAAAATTADSGGSSTSLRDAASASYEASLAPLHTTVVRVSSRSSILARTPSVRHADMVE